MEQDDRERVMRASWDANAGAWTTAVRRQLIPSRRAGTDAAIVKACERLRPGRVLDVGCGEGWLARALAMTGREVVGVDASAALVAEAQAAGGARFELLDYDALVHDPDQVPGPWDAIVCNFSLMGDPLAPIVAALGRRLGRNGRLVVQTVHPWTVAGDGPYADGWREETFADFGVTFPAKMPWFFRTLASWVAELERAGLVIVTLEEPVDATTGRPLSLLFEGAVIKQ